MQHDPSSDLMECLIWKHYHITNEDKRQHAMEIIRSGGDIHSVTEDNKTCLHLAMKDNCLLDVVQLLLENGIDANAQTSWGDTALHLTSYNRDQAETELVPILLYHGADPWIRNRSNETLLDLIIQDQFHEISRGFRTLVATIEHLCYYMFDEYTEFGVSVDALLKMADLDLPFFPEMVRTIKEVDLDNLETTGNVDIQHIFTMPSENLRLILDKFECVFTALFRCVNFKSRWSNMFRLENVYILVGSHLQRECIDWLCRWKLEHRFLDGLFKNDVPLASREKIVYFLLSCGMEIHGGDIETVYKYCGYDELFRCLRFMDVMKPKATNMNELIPRLVFQVTGDIQKSIEDPRFWVTRYTEFAFEAVLPYYAVPNLRDMCREVRSRQILFKKLLDRPQVPLLVEMARNVFRKYFVQRLGITSAKQFYEALELLPISSHHRKIIALETELY